jgi:hypothetical protein
MMKRIASLSLDERALIRRCLDAAVNGPFFPEWEYQTLFGHSRAEMRRLLATWPEVNDAGELSAIVNALNNLLGYPHNDTEAWRRYVRSSKEEVAAVLSKLLAEE